MKTITMYELLGLVKDGKAPKKVKYINSIWEYDEETKDYFHDDLWLIYSMNSIGLTEREVEILEEEEPRDIEVCGCWFTKSEYDKLFLEEKKKIPEKLIPTSLKGINDLNEKIDVAHIDTISAIDTINEIIDYLKSKGE